MIGDGIRGCGVEAMEEWIRDGVHFPLMMWETEKGGVEGS